MWRKSHRRRSATRFFLRGMSALQVQNHHISKYDIPQASKGLCYPRASKSREWPVFSRLFGHWGFERCCGTSIANQRRAQFCISIEEKGYDAQDGSCAEDAGLRRGDWTQRV